MHLELPPQYSKTMKMIKWKGMDGKNKHCTARNHPCGHRRAPKHLPDTERPVLWRGGRGGGCTSACGTSALWRGLLPKQCVERKNSEGQDKHPVLFKKRLVLVILLPGSSYLPRLPRRHLASAAVQNILVRLLELLLLLGCMTRLHNMLVSCGNCTCYPFYF